MTADNDIRQLVVEQRDRLGAFIEMLDDAEWESPSLCSKWLVRDVVAHCAQSHVATPWRLAAEMVAARFRLAVRNERWVAARRRCDRSAVLAEYRETANRLAVPEAELRYALLEVVIHGYDIAWPLGRTIEVPATSLVIVAQTCLRTPVFLGAKRRCVGISLRANDIDWSAGTGPEVTGPLALIVMAMAGRPVGHAELTGAELFRLPAQGS
ncbi:MAG TPA: maleylpyruvate isomerase family mycothiol-dependent enzyme [Pseudonocardiaceae bacterium]